jgi:hypothetical protein
MVTERKLQLAQSLGCLISAILMWHYGSDLEGTEFSGGQITGPLLRMGDAGILLFSTAALLNFLYQRIAAVVSLLASLLSLPLYVYFIAPGVFRTFFKGDYSVPAASPFVWDNSAIIALLVMTCTVFLSLRILFPWRVRSKPS